MKKRPLLATAVIAALTLAACGGSDTATTDTTAAAATGVDLVAAGCPATVSLQTDWNPEAEHGNLYQLIGPGYTVDKEKLRVSGDLMAGGKTTGVKVEIRAGGPAIGYSQVTAELYKDPSILLGFTSTDEQVSHSGDEFPTVAVVAPFNINPQIIMWDPATYPDVKTIADLKATGAKVRYFDGAAYMDYFTATGILDKKQVDATYDGSPASFIAAGGKDTQQGFGTAEPYFYKNVLKDAVNQYNNGWVYDAGQAKAAVAKMQEDKLVANSPDGTLGSFDMDRVTAFIATASPVFTSTGAKVKDGLVADDIVTNKYINPAIKLG